MATYTFDKIDYGGNTYVVQDSGALQLTGGTVTGPVTFSDSISITDATIGDLVVTGSASFTNNIQANTINGVAVGSSPKFSDTVTTVSTTGSGNAVTAVSASNGALTVTKGTTFLTAHNTYTISTTGSGNAVTAVSLSGTTFTVTKGATYNNYSHPSYTAADAAAKKIGRDSTGHVVIGDSLTASDVGAATSGHTHTLSIADSTGTSSKTLAHGGKYQLTAGGSTYIFTMPAAPTVPTSAASHTTGITASTTATKTTLGTAFTIPNVTSAGSASTWAFEEVSIPNVTAAGSGSFTSGSFSGGSGSFSATVASHVLSFSHTHNAATHGADSHTHTAPTIGTAIKVQSKKSGANGSAPTLGTAFTVPNVTGNTSATVSITDNGHTHTLS